MTHLSDEWSEDEIERLIEQLQTRVKAQADRIEELTKSKRVNEYEWKCHELEIALRNLDEAALRIKELERVIDIFKAKKEWICPACQAKFRSYPDWVEHIKVCDSNKEFDEAAAEMDLEVARK